ncbi:MAG: Asp-tRNA(Asn)/Glu-tRNA(Gln) amidotransferase subunit GatA, partial [Anaerolineae bacterium]
MKDLSLPSLTLHQARDLLRAGEISAEELTQAVLERILAVDNQVKAYLTLLPEDALRQARASDRRWAAWRKGKGPLPHPLDGMP